MSNSTTSVLRPSPERTSEILESLSEIRARVQAAAASSSEEEKASEAGTSKPLLVAVSKYKPSSDILVCYEDGQLDFGENYVQELVDKSKELPREIRWHFIGTLQSNKAKLLASIPNLHTLQTLSSTKSASALNKALSSLPPGTRSSPLNVLIQVNTSGEDSKSGLPPLSHSGSTISTPTPTPTPNAGGGGGVEDLKSLSKHIITTCPHLHLQGLMTIGALELSLNATETEKNADFERLKETRDVLQEWLSIEFPSESSAWGVPVGGEGAAGTNRKLVLSMGMSSDFEAAVKAGSDIVRVGTGIFGARKKKEEIKAQAGAPGS